MLENLKEKVLEANLDLKRSGLVIHTWGNVSGCDRRVNLVVIKPSGVAYEDLTIDSMVVVDLEGTAVEGKFKPSSDTASHLELYRNFSDIKGVVHTHSSFATSWAQIRKDIPCFGTTHADYFFGSIPCTRLLTEEEVQKDYELNMGRVIVEHFNANRINHLDVSGVLLAGHGPFTWGSAPQTAVQNSVVLEEIAKIAFYTTLLNRKTGKIPGYLLNKHYLRKHGKNSYYGQKEKRGGDAEP